MRDRHKEIKKRIAKRKRERMMMGYMSSERSVKDPYEGLYPPMYDTKLETTDYGFHPLWNKERFLMKVLAAAALVLLAAILFKDPSPKLDPFRTAVTEIMEREFQFAQVADWYESTFGRPLALLPERATRNTREEDVQYAVPANGQILEDFSSTSRGIVIQTMRDEEVAAVFEGTVIFAGNKENHGKIVIVQHADGSESWYGQLKEIYVKNYDQVKAGQALGVVKPTGADTGEFYFAIKKDKQFIDPVQVISFE